jgi:hypothetical protein
MWPQKKLSQLLTIPEFCEETRQSEATYYKARKVGRGPVECRFGPGGKKVFIRRDDAWLLGRRSDPTQDADKQLTA